MSETTPEERAMVDSSGCGPSERDGDYDSFTDDVDQCPTTPLLKTTLVNTTLFLDEDKTILNPLSVVPHLKLTSMVMV